MARPQAPGSLAAGLRVRDRSSPCFSLLTGRSRRSLRSAAHNNALDSNRFHKRFDAQRPEKNRELISLILAITGGGERIRFPAEEVARFIQMTAYHFENKYKNHSWPNALVNPTGFCSARKRFKTSGFHIRRNAPHAPDPGITGT
jgi:hypothetical protein